MEKYVYKGKNEEEVLNSALEELKLTKEDIFYRTYEEKTGLLKSKKTVVEFVKIRDVAELGKNILDQVLEGLNINGKIETKIRENRIYYQIFSDNNSRLIGKNGKALESLQIYLRQALNSKVGIACNIMIDVENYRDKQNYFLEKNVKKIARQVTLSKIDVKLDPMNAYERRIVHNALTKFDYIETESVGEEPNRQIVIKYVERKK